MSRSTISTFKLFELFPTNDSARLYLEARLWPDGPICPDCKGDRISNPKEMLPAGHVEMNPTDHGKVLVCAKCSKESTSHGVRTPRTNLRHVDEGNHA
jgi:Transposase zinc-ribbon domain